MSTIEEAMGVLAAALGCEPFVPDVIDPPCVVIGPGDGFVQPGNSFALTDATLALEVFVLVEITDGSTMLAQLAQALPAVLAVVAAQEGWGIDSVSRPDVFTTADWTAYGVQVNVSRFLDLDVLATPAVPNFTLTDPA